MANWSFGAPGGGSSAQKVLTVEERALAEVQAGDALCAQQAFSAALAHYAEAVRLQPDEARYRWFLALCERSNGQDDSCGRRLEELTRSHPEFAFGHSCLAEWYLFHSLVEEALDASSKAIALDPENLGVLGARANILVSVGRIDEALAIVQGVVQTGRRTVPIVVLYAKLAGRNQRIPEALSLVEKVLAGGGLARRDEASLRFSAAEIFDGLGRYDEAFAEAARANQLAAEPWNPAAHERQIDARIAFFSRQRAVSLPKAAYRSDKPVLVVGMPRSGTSLVEQILASHPAVYGAGELDFLYWTFSGMLNMLGAREDQYPDCLNRMSADHATGMAQIYVEPLIALSPSAARIIDKMPLNCLHLGFASLILPEARIIHCRRDAVDTCLSCYMTDFAGGKEFKCDLEHLGRFYRQYERLMAHWKEVLELKFLDVDYEEMIANTPRQTRHMLKFLGLPWDDGCAKFYETRRAVATASVHQVRRPIYNSSLQRWRHYEKHLEPLMAALGR